MNRPEPIELENNLGPDAVTGEINRVPWMAYDVDEMDLYIAEKDKEIAELKKKLMPCLNGDCILTCEVVEKYGKENAELKAKRHDYERKFRLRHRPGKLRQIDFTITLLGSGTFTAHVLTTRRTAA